MRLWLVSKPVLQPRHHHHHHRPHMQLRRIKLILLHILNNNVNQNVKIVVFLNRKNNLLPKIPNKLNQDRVYQREALWKVIGGCVVQMLHVLVGHWVVYSNLILFYTKLMMVHLYAPHTFAEELVLVVVDVLSLMCMNVMPSLFCHKLNNYVKILSRHSSMIDKMLLKKFLSPTKPLLYDHDHLDHRLLHTLPVHGVHWLRLSVTRFMIHGANRMMMNLLVLDETIVLITITTIFLKIFLRMMLAKKILIIVMILLIQQNHTIILLGLLIVCVNHNVDLLQYQSDHRNRRLFHQLVSLKSRLFLIRKMRFVSFFSIIFISFIGTR
mmetsp:Transcript_21316/g.32688  ORF Transcript_21316/g.32688 Transcript_21316/m.32688 type:complete len:325 (-) Transcript_21316:327-1301(-)